jgi:hypothetical protein
MIKDKLTILELFCGAGGDTPGMIAAGARVIGVDRDPRCEQFYPGRFICHDVFTIEQVLDWQHIIDSTDLVWLSPKCEGNSHATNIRASNADHADQIGPARAMVEKWGKPYIIENVPEAAGKFHRMRADIKLNGYTVGLMLDRPRVFEISGFTAVQPRYITKNEVTEANRQKCSVFGRLVSSKNKGGHERYEHDKYWRPIQMGIDHIPVNAGSSPDPETGRTYNLLALAVPPAMAEYLVKQFIKWRNDHP